MKPNSVKRVIAILTSAGFLSLSIAQPMLAFDSFKELGGNGDAKIYGLSLTGDLNFKRMSINSFAYAQTDGVTGNYNDGGIVSFSNGMLKTDLPMLTFGDNVRYPGVIYNHKGEQFFNHIAAATEGSVESQTVIWPYVLGGIVVAGGIVALIGSSSSDDDEPATTPNATTNTETPPVILPQQEGITPLVEVPKEETFVEVEPISFEPVDAPDDPIVVGPLY